MKQGIVYLVGAGPGDPGLITEKAKKILEKADCVIYDYLASQSFVDSLTCEKIFVGKKGSEHTMPQEEINRLLTAKAKEGKLVVRLKGGDPFIFGRGGEEAEELIEAGIRFQIIPGVSSFYAAPAYAGIPLTHRDYANAFEVITGHRRDDSPDEEDINFPEYDPQKTFVFLMGMKNLRYISERLISYKKFPKTTPVGIISWGTTPEQKVATGTLADIHEKATTSGIGAPAIIVIGKVVLLRDKLRWFDTRPLSGKTIVVTRTREQASVLSEKLSELGARVIEFPTIEIRRRDMSELSDAIRRIGDYHWIIFTSQNAVKIFFDALKANGKDARCLTAKIAAIGPATTFELNKYFIMPDLMPSEYVAEAILREIQSKDIAGQRILLPCASEARPVLKDGLAGFGATVDRIHIYDTIIPENIPEDILSELQNADVITFASSSTVKNFFSIIKNVNAKLACIGPVTADTVKALGYSPDIVASEYTIDGLVEAIVKYYKK